MHEKIATRARRPSTYIHEKSRTCMIFVVVECDMLQRENEVSRYVMTIKEGTMVGVNVESHLPCDQRPSSFRLRISWSFDHLYNLILASSCSASLYHQVHVRAVDHYGVEPQGGSEHGTLLLKFDSRSICQWLPIEGRVTIAYCRVSHPIVHEYRMEIKASGTATLCLKTYSILIRRNLLTNM